MVDEGRQVHRIYIDGVVAASTTGTTTAATVNMDELYVGSLWSANYYDGQIEQLSISDSAWTESEVRLEYQRMVHASTPLSPRSSPTPSTRCVSDPDTGLAVVCNGGKAQVWDVTLGLGVSSDDAPAGTLRDADMKAMDGADVPHYAMGTSTRVGVGAGRCADRGMSSKMAGVIKRD